LVERTGLDRRSFLSTAGGAGAALAAPSILRWSSAAAASATPTPMAAPAARGEALLQPSEIRSRNGVLRATIRAAAAMVRLGEYRFDGFLYNGADIPPVLRARVGDTMRITFKNDLAESAASWTLDPGRAP
jgi:FtsP/CotA-like multicopper oxidase with cupredoxin domain